ncbi:hypothetical protein JKP88DRAFT_332442 [Tribonema minus]|uniref:Histone deacetylase n=1 Tax=Tribonema minus TaxID=303371 RepID=A0A835YMW5_9STRA|nr:hypothetical protein JKP88DRAFT_332442 [Tribonema minus]
MHSTAYERLCGLMAAHDGRDALLYSLMDACVLTQRLTVTAPALAAASHVAAFHSQEFIKALQRPPDDEDALETYGLVDDCEVFPGLWNYACAVAGASLQAAALLARGAADVAINWGGGRHHASRARAAGFCFVNDCTLATLHLLRKFKRVLYVDVDVHHPDGVQDAFYQSDAVLCLSLHHWSPGFFPHPAGAPHETGRGRGAGYNVNVPLAERCCDAAYQGVFDAVFDAAVDAFRPACVVLQCGADALGADPIGRLNLTTRGLQACVRRVIAARLPTLVLGGGGYDGAATARLWTALTATAIGEGAEEALPSSVPDHPHFARYGPSFDMHTAPRRLRDANAPEALRAARDRALATLDVVRKKRLAAAAAAARRPPAPAPLSAAARTAQVEVAEKGCVQ